MSTRKPRVRQDARNPLDGASSSLRWPQMLNGGANAEDPGQNSIIRDVQVAAVKRTAVFTFRFDFDHNLSNAAGLAVADLAGLQVQAADAGWHNANGIVNAVGNQVEFTVSGIGGFNPNAAWRIQSGSAAESLAFGQHRLVKDQTGTVLEASILVFQAITGTNNYLVIFSEPIDTLDPIDFTKFTVDGAEATSLVASDATSVTLGFDAPASGGLDWTYSAGGVLFASKDYLAAASGVTSGPAVAPVYNYVKEVFVQDNPNNRTWLWSFVDANGDDVQATGPSPILTEAANLQIQIGGVYTSPTSATLDASGNIVCTYPAYVPVGAPWTVLDNALEFANSGTLLPSQGNTVGPVVSREIFVATNGNDTTGDGSITNPYKTPQKGHDVALPGDTVYFRGGTYVPQAGQFVGNWSALLKITTSGTAAAPIRYRNYNNEIVILDPSGGKQEGDITSSGSMFYGILLGDYVGSYAGATGVSYIWLDGLRVRLPGRAGIEMVKASNCRVVNCQCDRASQYGGFYAGLEMIGACDSNEIAYNRMYGGGNGIFGFEDDLNSLTPRGQRYCNIHDNFCYGNYPKSGNVGNANGIALRFGEENTIEGNVCYDNPDAGINGLGSIRNRYISNACLDNWQPGGNQDGIKFSVRGGGANIVCGNLSFYNDTRGYEQTKGIGDVVVNNTFYNNGWEGVAWDLPEGLGLNNIAAFNSRVNTGAINKEFNGTDSAQSDYNTFQTIGPAESPVPAGRGLRDNELRADPRLVNPYLNKPRTTLRQIIHPEQIWGGANLTCAQVRAALADAFAPTDASCTGNGLAASDIQALVDDATPGAYLDRVLAALTDYEDGTPVVHPQAPYVFGRALTLLGDGGYGTLDLKDLTGAAIGETPDRGCCAAVSQPATMTAKVAGGAGSRDVIFTSTVDIAGISGFAGVQISYDGTTFVPCTTIRQVTARNVRVAFAQPVTAGLRWRYTGSGITLVGDTLPVCSGIVRRAGLTVTPIVSNVSSPDNTTQWWQFEDEDGAFPIYCSGPSDSAAFAAACAGLQCSPNTVPQYESPSFVFAGADYIEATYDHPIPTTMPWRTTTPAASLTFEDGQTLAAGLTGTTVLG